VKKMIIIFIMLIILISTVAYATTSYSVYKIDTANSSSGVLSVQHPQEFTKKVKLLIEKNDKQYYYNLYPDAKTECFPLSMGDGTYQITIFENIERDRYKPILSEYAEITLKDERQPFLQSVQAIEWDDSMAAIKEARKMTKSLKTDEEKVAAIYGYILRNIRYDHSKISNIDTAYLPNIDETFTTKKGICYDFASIFAGMLRSVGIPAKLVKGYAQNVIGYHAWNEVFLNGQWIIIDTSYDAQKRAVYGKYSMIKDTGAYSAKYAY